jgi:NAD(P)H-dependent FMN reductase
MTTTKILAFAGSARKDSFNKKLVKIAVAGAKASGAEVTYLAFWFYQIKRQLEMLIKHSMRMAI